MGHNGGLLGDVSLCSVSWLVGRLVLGAAHGLAGILFALMLSQPYMRARTSARHLVREAIDYLISVTPADTGNLPAATDELPPHHRTPKTQELVHWCHGAAGAVYVYARAYVLWNDEVYLRAAKRCADVVWTRGLLKKGPGICHGVAGSGYTQLLLYRLTGEERYLGRAGALAVFMQEEDFRRHARRPDNPLSLFEGRAGTAAFLADLANPQQASFPFMDVFDADVRMNHKICFIDDMLDSYSTEHSPFLKHSMLTLAHLQYNNNQF